MTDSEKLVRETWEWFAIRKAEPFEGFSKGSWIVRVPVHGVIGLSSNAREKAVVDASDFTRAWLKDIAERKEEIEWVRQKKYGCAPAHELETASDVYRVPRRILSRLTEALAAKKQGMRSKEEK
jgi:hypothetical protein